MAEAHYRKPQEPDDDVTNGRMGFLEHLDELRTRLIRSCLALVVGMLIAFAFVDRIANFVLAPMLGLLPAVVWSFDSPRMRLMPRVEDTFELYKNMLIGMVAVFQIPTLVFFLARLQLVTARFLWRHIKYAILISFVAAAALTPSADPWNQ